jgi:hypothetical protein
MDPSLLSQQLMLQHQQNPAFIQALLAQQRGGPPGPPGSAPLPGPH